jgi:hypothetical protein
MMKWRGGPPGQHRARMAAALAGAAALATIGAVTAPVAGAVPTVGGTHRAGAPQVTAGHAVKIKKVGTVNFSALARAAARRHRTRALGTPREMPQRLPASVTRSTRRAVKAVARVPRAAHRARFTGNVPGERGFNGMDHAANEATVGFDISPPDHGLAVGTSSKGTIVLQFLNLSLQAFTPTGKALTPPVGADAFFGLSPRCTGTGFPVNCPSDPRVYWDPRTRHWFVAAFTFSSAPLGLQYIAVSDTTNGLGSYTVFSLPTAAGFINPADCPCLGDFDQIGADSNGFYLTENEFGQTSFHGAVLFAMSKASLIAAANGGPAPTTFVYTVPTAADPFGGFRLAPSSVTMGSFSPSTEYFVEADANQFSDTSLEVWALLHTGRLNGASPSAPPLVATNVATEGYSVPPPATQKAGPIPFGNSVGALVAEPLDSGFDIQQGVTYASGNLYVQLATGITTGGASVRAGLAWLVLHPTPRTSSISVTNKGNGYVTANAQLLYPTISVNASGHGWMGFTVAGASRFPSAAYIRFDGTHGAVGPIHIAKAGTVPLDDFTCYPTDGNGPTCRYGDYSASQFFNGRTYFGVEYVHALTNVAAGADTNWASRVFSVPAH